MHPLLTRQEIMARRARVQRRRMIVKIIDGAVQGIGIVVVLFGVIGLGELLCVLAGVGA